MVQQLQSSYLNNDMIVNRLTLPQFIVAIYGEGFIVECLSGLMFFADPLWCLSKVA